MAGGGQGAGAAQGNAGIPPQQAAIGQAALQGYNPQALMQQLNAMSSSPPSPMQYPQQGQPNLPPQTQSSVLPSTAFMGGPDSGADYAPANMGFDGSGSDGGVGGQPAPMQTPLGATSAGMNSGLPQVQGNKPLGLAQFQQPQGLQIAGNPTSQIVQRPQQR